VTVDQMVLKIIIAFFILLFVILVFVFIRGKSSNLIAGYNTMSTNRSLLMLLKKKKQSL